MLKLRRTEAHETFKLGFDNILALLDTPPTNDLKNFLGYCEAWAVCLEQHHASEGTSIDVLMVLVLLPTFLQRGHCLPISPTEA